MIEKERQFRHRLPKPLLRVHATCAINAGSNPVLQISSGVDNNTRSARDIGRKSPSNHIQLNSESQNRRCCIVIIFKDIITHSFHFVVRIMSDTLYLPENSGELPSRSLPSSKTNSPNAAIDLSVPMCIIPVCDTYSYISYKRKQATSPSLYVYTIVPCGSHL